MINKIGVTANLGMSVYYFVFREDVATAIYFMMIVLMFVLFEVRDKKVGE